MKWCGTQLCMLLILSFSNPTLPWSSPKSLLVSRFFLKPLWSLLKGTKVPMSTNKRQLFFPFISKTVRLEGAMATSSETAAAGSHENEIVAWLWDLLLISIFILTFVWDRSQLSHVINVSVQPIPPLCNLGQVCLVIVFGWNMRNTHGPN